MKCTLSKDQGKHETSINCGAENVQPVDRQECNEEGKAGFFELCLLNIKECITDSYLSIRSFIFGVILFVVVWSWVQFLSRFLRGF